MSGNQVSENFSNFEVGSTNNQLKMEMSSTNSNNLLARNMAPNQGNRHLLVSNELLRDRSVGAAMSATERKPSQQTRIGNKQEQLLSRLASGQKTLVDEKSMKKLTTRNYQKLPEIRKKEEQKRLREEQAAKREKAKLYQKELNERLRQGM